MYAVIHSEMDCLHTAISAVDHCCDGQRIVALFLYGGRADVFDVVRIFCQRRAVHRRHGVVKTDVITRVSVIIVDAAYGNRKIIVAARSR